MFKIKSEKYEGKTELDSINGEVVFDNVTFSYKKKKPVLKNVSFKVKPGEIVALVGESGVGKSTFREVWLGGKFRTQYLMTLGADFAAKEIILKYSHEEFHLKYQIWDLAGQPRFKVVGELYYRGAVGALCFFDITNQDSFLNLKEWINCFWTLNGKGIRPLLLVGTKVDLRDISSTDQMTFFY